VTHDLALERAALGAFFMAGKVWPVPDVEAFTNHVHREALAVMAEADTLSTEALVVGLSRRGVRTDAALELVTSITSIAVTSGDAAALVTRLDELARQRRAAASRREASRAIEAGDLDEAERAIARARETGSAPRVSSRWISDLGEDPIGEEPPRRRFLLRRVDGPHPVGWLPAGEVGLLVAHGGIGKSTVLMQLALSIASGAPLFDVLVPSDPGPVALLALEDDLDEVRRRLHWASVAAWLDEDTRALAASRIRVITPPRDTVLVAPDDRGVPREQPVVGEILRDLAGGGVEWRAVILDPLNRLHACDENANGAMGHVVATIERFKELPGRPTILVAHHSAKGPGAAASRGASAIVNGARWCAHLEPDEGDTVRLEVVKSNYTARGAPIALTRKRETRGALVRLTAEEEAAIT
jgi:hypothetical protein